MKLHGEQTEQKVALAAEQFIRDFFSRNKDTNFKKSPGEDHLLRLQTELGIPDEGRDLDTVIAQLTRDVYPYGLKSDDPKYTCFIPGPASKIAWLADMMTNLVNRFAGSFMNFPTGALIEQETLRWLADKAGFGENASGLFVSGGSMANLTALIAARDKCLGYDNITRGVAYVSEQTHSSVLKALRIIGIPNERIRILPVDEAYRMVPETLERQIRKDQLEKLVPFVVIASAGTTNTGGIDPFAPLADIAKKYGLWLHVDGAFGASVLLSDTHRHLLDGIERADSLAWDGHKWLFQNFASGIVLVRDKQDLLNSFSVRAEYLTDLEQRDEIYNPSELGIELTRPSRGLKLWFTLQVAGAKAMGEAIDAGFERAELFEAELRKNPKVEIVTPAHMAIVNFRYKTGWMGTPQLNEYNHRISKRMLESEYAGIMTTELDGRKVLRFCSLHPELTPDTIREIVARLNAFAEDEI